jgi:hypothetical protein
MLLWLIWFVVALVVLVWWLASSPSPPSSPSSLSPPSLGRRVLQPLDWEACLRQCGDELVKFEYFGDATGRPLLDPLIAPQWLRLRDWWREPTKYRQWGAKLKFNSQTKTPLTRYVWELVQPQLPPAVKERLAVQEPILVLRLNTGGWRYPDHFDCIDNYALILAGQRSVRLDQGAPLHLRAGDWLYIPSGQYHEFSCPASQAHNLLLNVDFTPTGEERARCQARFISENPVQVARIIERVEYVD